MLARAPRNRCNHEGVVGVTETRQHFAAILERVLDGEQVIVTRRGEPVAAIVPAPQETDPAAEPVGLAAFAGALPRRSGIDEAAAAVVAMRSLTREREPAEIG